MNFNFLNKINLNLVLVLTGVVVLGFVIAFFVWWNKEITILGPRSEEEAKPRSSLAGLECDNVSRRPVAVMMASDSETRPLSGISVADMVFEMPVAPNGITRFMAMFQCEIPEEIGSIRSAREEFIPLVGSFGAIYAHWGGERDALAKLNNGALNNIDALRYEGTVFYRKNSIPRPHNGFTDMDLLLNKAKDLGYSLQDEFGGYARGDDEAKRTLSNIAGKVTVNYPQPFNVEWTYDSQTNLYSRFRGGTPEMDRNTNETVKASVIIVMNTTSHVLNKDYIRVNVSGEGEAVVYQNGYRTTGRWEKDDSVSSKLYFYDENGQELKLTSGKIWIHIVTD